MGSKQNYQWSTYKMHNIKYHKYILGSSPQDSSLHLSTSSASSTDVPEKSDLRNQNTLKTRGLRGSQDNLHPPPPRDISKENLGIWIGWTSRSDREVVREAASKGHVPLASKFLSLRQNVGADRITEFINSEVLIWADELLTRKLIYRVSSILTNIGSDPIYELQNIFYKTTKADRREYIGNHLRNQNALPTNYEQLWTFLDIIIENKVLTHHSSLLEDSIENLEKKSDGWKEHVAAKLFLTTHDSRLLPLVKADVLWNQLLTTNEIHLLRAWIQIAYSSHTEMLNVPENLLMIIKSFPITEDMIKDLSNSNLPPDSFEKVLNELAQYGIFIESEKFSVLKVLSRINATDSLVNIYEILGHKHSNLPLIKFIPMLIDYCLENDLLIVLNACTSNFDLSVIPKLKESPHLDLMRNFRNLVLTFEEDCLRDNIFNVAKYLCEDDLEKYFCDNPIIFLALLILTEGISVEKCVNEKSLVLNDTDFYNCLSNVMKQYQLLSSLYFRKIRGVKCSITYFDLLQKHLNIDVRRAFAFHFEGTPLLNFNSPELREGFAYSKKVDYTFYLKQHRPSIASKRFFLDVLKDSGSVGEEAKNLVQKKTFKIAIKNFQNVALVASCITFLEIIGIGSERLRVTLKAADLLLQSGMDIDNVTSLFLSCDKDARVIQTLLDENMVKFIDFNDMMSCGSDFVKAVKVYDIVVKFSLLHNLPLPESFLRHLTQNNLWFPFLLYAQMKNYPVDQIKKICSHFKNPNLLEHVVHSVLHDIQIDETNVLMRQRDSRKYLLSKLGVRRSLDVPSGASGSLKSKSVQSGSSDSGSSGSELLEIDISNTKATLLQTLIRCHNSTDPPKALLQASQLYRNPLLAIFATSYEPDSVITNWLTWLAVSTDLYEIFTNFESVSSSSQQVTDLLDNCMKNRFPRTLFQSCVIFVPDNPLTPFCNFLNRVIARDYEIQYLTPQLETFKSLKSSRRASVLSQTDYEMTYLKNKVWLETTALQLLCSAIIYNADSLFDQLVFVELLCQINIQAYFTCEVPKFENLLVILKTIFDTGVDLNLANFLDPSKEKESVQNCVNDLVKRHLYSESLTVAKCSDLDTDMIVLKKWQNKFELRNQGIEQFLVKCDSDFELQGVSPEYVISFFNERASINDMERYYLLKFSHKWASTHNLPSLYELERKKILAFIKIAEQSLDISELEDLNIDKNYVTYKEMLDILETIQQSQVTLTTNYLDRLNQILLEALDKKNFWLALKLERMFGCDSHDLDVLKLCHELAEGLVSPSQLNGEQQQVIDRVRRIRRLSHRRRSFFKSTSMSSDRNYLELIEEETDFPESPIQATLGLIHSLIEKLTHGSDLAYTVFMKYRISSNIEVPYNIVVSNTDPLKMLKDALQDDCMNKLEVVHDFFEVFEWSKEEITDFVCDQFVTAASNYSKSKIDIFSMWDIKIVEQFHLVLKLIKDECSTLGYKFYNYASAVHQQQVTADLDFKISEMSLVVELLIAAHSCFTADCNMEGISTILKKCRKVISHLLNVRSWKLIVRLLTGVGRYTELNSVFNLLKENDQFEFLLSKGSKRDERLKIACIEYLKKYFPQDKKLYELVAIHFNLYSEVARVWEREAQGFLKNLIAVAETEMQNKRMSTEPIDFVVLTKSEGTHMLLHKAMEKYVLAAEFHTQGEKLTNAMNAAKQAELIALQKSLLRGVANNETVPCMLNLSHSKITKLMSKELNFHQSHILAQAYNFSPDWSQIIYEQAITNNNIDYFDQFSETIGITDELIQDIARKFLGNQVVKNYEFRNIKHIIEQLESVHVKYRLASELGFKGLAQEVIDTGEISYLKDTVWKSGYKGRSASKSTEQ